MQEIYIENSVKDYVLGRQTLERSKRLACFFLVGRLLQANALLASSKRYVGS